MWLLVMVIKATQQDGEKKAMREGLMERNGVGLIEVPLIIDECDTPVWYRIT